MNTLNFSELGFLYEKFLDIYRARPFRAAVTVLIAVLYLSVPSANIPFLEYNHFRITSLMEQRAIENFLVFYPRQSWAGFSDVNPNLFRAIVSMEDGRFFGHKGIDWMELEKSLKTNKRRKRVARGGSTITMQLAKNMYLRTDRNFIRKGKELVIAIRMEKELSKDVILTNYVNAVEWGDGIFGIKEAAREYFDKKPSELTLRESARLAAVIPAPLLYKPNEDSRYVKRRSSIIRGRYDDVTIPEK